MRSSGIPQTLRSVDWSITSLGPPSRWPPELLTAVRTLLPSRLPMMICWGEDLVQIYNQAFAPLLGDKHPFAMGQGAASCWAEQWPRIESLVEDYLAGDAALFTEHVPLFLDRNGYREETYWRMSLNVIPGADNERQGLLLSAIEDTSQVVSNRRLSTIHELSVMSTAGMMSLADVCQAALKVMSRNRAALPFATCYLRDDGQLRLVASYGAASRTTTFPESIEVGANLTIARAARTGLAELTDHLDEVASPEGIEPSPLGMAVPRSAMLIPLLLSGDLEPVGVLVLGTNPYRAVDAAYRSFFDLVSRQLGTLLTGARAYQEQHERAEMLAALQDSKTRFFQNVSHEFRTPLTLVLGGLDALNVTGSGPEAQQIEAARRAALRLERLVDALLTFAQAESGALVTQLEPTDLAQLTREAASMFQSAVEEASIEYQLELPDQPVVVSIDREMWSRVVVNLLSNAYKFTRQGRIRIRLNSSPDGVTLTVEDTGVGIEPEALGRVFQRFEQAQSAQVRSRPGAGIGLSLVADLVSAHHGTVDVTSEPGVGSTFTVHLPVKTSSSSAGPSSAVAERIQAQTISDISSPARPEQWHTEAGRDTDTASDRATKRAATKRAEDNETRGVVAVQDGTAVDPTGRRLLLVEDNADLRQYLTRLLRTKGWSVTAVPDAESALRHSEVPDIILTDVMLPGKDGLTLVRILRANPDLATVPVILLTARAGAEAAAQGLRAGADDYIVKPFNAEELLARLDVHHELTCLRNYALAQAKDQVSNLETALSSNRRIGAAIGVVMATRKVTSQAAFEVLRQASNESNRTLREVADRVVLTGGLDRVI